MTDENEGTEAETPVSVEASEEEGFEIRILRDNEERPTVMACKMPRPGGPSGPGGMDFDLMVTNVGTKDVRVSGRIQRIKEEK